MRTAYNESLRPSRALLQHSSSQIGSIVWPARPNDASSHTPPVPPTKLSGFLWERSRSLFGCPRNNRAAEKENLDVHNESAHDHRLHGQ